MKEMQESLSAKNPHQCISSRRSRKRLACGQRRERSISPIYYCACDLRPSEMGRVGFFCPFINNCICLYSVFVGSLLFNRHSLARSVLKKKNLDLLSWD